ncbi:MAG: diaminopimelate decarboxylase [Polyangiaceae bacterium]|nr:diaminopimelate decarboxylase [Polyangiaceae bacterium]
MGTLMVGSLGPAVVVQAARQYGTPLYLYDERTIVERCRNVLAMPNAFGLHAGYAMKANANRAIVQLVAREGIGIDASSLNEVRRARMAGIASRRIVLTTQEVPEGADRSELETLMSEGLLYNACSLRQLHLVAEFAARTRARLSMRVNPGVGSGETVTRNTGDNYSSFGIHMTQLAEATSQARKRGLTIEQVHVHIGSGGDPAVWQSNVDRMLAITEQYFPSARTLNLGGGFKEARMPEEIAADVQALGHYAERRFRQFAERTGRRLVMAVEPGTYVMANSGYLVTSVIDKKWSGPEGFEFLVVNGGMECNTRPALYGSRHPFYVVSANGSVLSSDFDPAVKQQPGRVVAGRCCESGDSQTLDAEGHVVPRPMADPSVGDYVVIGGVGAYCASMSVFNYNSHRQAPEVLLREDGSLQLIRRRQTLEQITANEFALDE